MPRPIRALIALGLLVFLLLARWLDVAPLPQMRNGWFDFASGIMRPQVLPENPARIIAIDDESLDAFGRWPWPRDIVADLVRAADDAGALAVGVDLLLVGEAPGDDVLAGVLASAPVVLGTAIVDSEGGPRLLEPLDSLSAVAEGEGYLSAWADGAGYLREVPAQLAFEDEVVPAFAVEIARLSRGAQAVGLSLDLFGQPARLSFGRGGIPLDTEGRILPDLRMVAPAPEISAAAVLAGDVNPSELRDRIVLIGATATGLDSRWSVPGHGVLTGVAVQSMLTEALVGGTVLLRNWIVIAVELLAGALAIGWIFTRGAVMPMRSLVVVCGAGALALLASGIAARLALDVQADVTWPASALVLSLGMMSSLRFGHLRREASRLREFSSHLIDQAEDIILTLDARDRVVSANGAAQELFGVPERLIIGRPVSTFLTMRSAPDAVSQVGSGSHAEVLEAATKVPPAARLADLEFRRSPLEGVGMAERLLIGRDITRLRFVERRLDATSERLQAVLDIVPVGVALFGEDRRLLVSNVAFRDLLGVADVSSQPNYDKVLCGWQRYGLDPAATFQDDGEMALESSDCAFDKALPQIYLTDSDGRWLCLHQNRPRDGGLLVAAIDETANHDRAQAMNAEMERATEAEAAKGFLLANVSHELRTPLNAILGFSEIITHDLESVRPLKYAEYIEHIHDSAGYLLSLVDDLLEFSAPGDSGAAERSASCDLCAEIAAATASVSAAAEKAGIELTCNLPPNPVRVRMAPHHIRQIVVNLATNGVKFTPAGGTVAITMGVSDTASIAITVADTGVGMTQQELDRTSRRFSRARNGVRGEKGYGLGLAIVKSIVPIYGLSFDISAAQDKGTAARVTIPASLRIRDEHTVAGE